MKAAPLLVAWHNDKAPIYSAQFDPHGHGRLATAGGDNNIRLWKIENSADERKVTYLSTLVKHTQAVNVVRWCPRGELLSSAGDDGNILLWVPSEHHPAGAFGEEDSDDKETWIVKRMCRSSSGYEIYDLAWSPDGAFFITGSMDNVARIFDAQSGNVVRQIAEHNHYVQGVAWDPLNEFIATQSSDRSVHIYKLRTNDGQFSLSQHSKMAKMDLPARRVSSNSPAPPDFGHRSILSSTENTFQSDRVGSPVPSAPGTPTSLPLPMNPPPPTSSHSRRTSRGNSSPSLRRSPSPAPSLPLPAVMPSASPNPSAGAKNANIYANETLTSFFRRLTFAPDGSLLFTPAGQYKAMNSNTSDAAKAVEEIINTVYIYSRGGLNKPPVAHLPGHKKPSVAVRCSPVFYNLRLPTTTKQITIDTSSSTDDITPLPDPILPSKDRASSSTSMDPPPPATAPSPAPSTTAASPKSKDADSKAPPDGPPPAFALPYRIVYAVATQDAVFVYDTQQQSPICVVSNLHFATFTDLTWSNDGNTLLMTSSDGFCSYLSFASGELGKPYHGSLSSRTHHPSVINTSASASSTPAPTPTSTSATFPQLVKHPSSAGFATSPSPGFPPTSTSVPPARPVSPTRSNSASSVATQSSAAVVSNPTPSVSNLPGVAAASSGTVTGPTGPLTSPTPPMTPASVHSQQAHSQAPSQNPPSNTASFASTAGATASVLGKRESESESDAVATDNTDTKEVKKRRVAPTLVSGVDRGLGNGTASSGGGQDDASRDDGETK